MHPATAVGIAGAATVVSLAILKFFFVITGFLFLCAAALASNIARFAPRFAIVVIPISALMIAHYDLFEISKWSIWYLFYTRYSDPYYIKYKINSFGYVYQYTIMSFMILGTLGGLQRRYNGDRPYIISVDPLTFNGTFWEPGITPLFGWWLLSTLIAIAVIAFGFAPPIMNTVVFVANVISAGFNWTWYYIGQLCIIFAGFVVLYLIFTVLDKVLPRRLQYFGMFLFLVGSAIPLFFLTTTYDLPLFHWETYVSWGLYVGFVALILWRRYRGKGRAGLWGSLRWSVAILATLIVASDIDWMLKQRFERNIFGLYDPTIEYARLEGKPRVAWGGLPRMALGFSPADLAFESLAPLFASSAEPPRNTGAASPSSSAGKHAVIPPAQATPRTASAPVPTQVRSRELPLPPPPPPPALPLSTSSPGGKPDPFPLSSSSRGASSEDLLGERKAPFGEHKTPSFGSGSTGRLEKPLAATRSDLIR